MRILFLLSRFPYPLEKGDKLRSFHQIKRLSQHHEIILFAISDRDINKKELDALSPFCEHIEIFQLSKFNIVVNLMRALFSDLPFQASYFYNSKAKKHLSWLILQKKPDRIFCQLLRMAPYTVSFSGVPVLFDYMDVFSAGLKRRMSKTPFFFKWIFKNEYNRTREYEAFVKNKFNTCTIISEQDRDLLEIPEKNEIMIVPNGVDCEYFFPFESKKVFDLLFTGNMNYPPNIEAAGFIYKVILPKIKIKKKGIKLCIAGTNPAGEIIRMINNDVTVTGWVEDIRPYYSYSKIFLAPMQIGTGLQNKLLEAMSMKIPCITSPLANNAIKAIDSESILIARTDDDYVKHVLYLLENPEDSAKIGNAGREFVKNNFNWDVIVEKLEELIENAGKCKV